jgi:chorismate--pyruvate lyase
MQSWLLNTGSLTERLQALCNKFEVKVLGQKNVALDDTEISALKSSNNSDWQIREVILYGDDKPWVFARSVLPDHMCRSTWADLGTQPLGQRIFNDASFVRSGFEIGLLHHHPISRESFAHSTLAQATHQQMWARRSMFSRKKDTLLVAEAFLPDCPCYKVNK